MNGKSCEVKNTIGQAENVCTMVFLLSNMW